MNHEDAATPTVGKQRRSVLVVVLVVLSVLLALGGIASGLWVLLSMPARQEITRIEPADRPLTDTPEQQAAVTIEDDAREVVDALEGTSDAWADSIANVAVVTRLRRPVVEVRTSLGPEDAEGAERFTSELTRFVERISQDTAGGPTYYIDVLSTEGDLVATVAHTDVRWLLATPPAPADAASLQGWLSEVYGPGAERPEPWFARIVELRDPAEDADGYIVIATDLDPAVPGDIEQAQWIISAVDSSGATFSPAVRVLFKDPSFEWSSVIDGVDPFAP